MMMVNSGSFALADDPVEGTVYEAAAAPAGCTTTLCANVCETATPGSLV